MYLKHGLVMNGRLPLRHLSNAHCKNTFLSCLVLVIWMFLDEYSLLRSSSADDIKDTVHPALCVSAFLGFLSFLKFKGIVHPKMVPIPYLGELFL